MKKDMTAGREWSTVLAFSLPIMGANLLQVLYNFADSVIVGNFISSTALGAVGLTSSMTWLLVAFCSALGSGTNIAAAQFYGAKKEKEIKETAAASYLMAAALSVVLTLACFLLARPVIEGFLQAPEEMRADSRTYFLIYSCGIIFQLLYNVTYGILRAHGDSRGALIFLLISAVLNVVLDCVFIVIFHMGVAGAAIATVIAQAGSAVASMIYLWRLFPDLIPSPKYLYAWKEQTALLTRLSVPIILQTTVTSLGFILLQRLINSFGTPSIEGYSAMLKIEQLAHIPSQSFNVAISSFAGQNIGAGQLARAKKGYRSTVLMGVLISICISAAVIFFDEELLGLFNITGESLRRGREHLDLLMLFIWVNTIMNITCGFLQGAGDVKLPATSSFINLGVRLALSYLFAATAIGFRSYYVSMPPAWVLACTIVVLRYRSGKWENYRLVK